MTDTNTSMIRLELLKLAQSILFDTVITQRQQLENDWNINVEDITDFPELPIITTEQIIEEATKLNKFVFGE